MSSQMTYLEACCKMVKVPETGIAEWFIVVVGYLREDGTSGFRYAASPKSPTAQVCYALGGIQHDIYDSATVDVDPGEDDLDLE